MEHAFPHDELMPISCKPRIRGVTPSRGDVDDSLGNFSLTLVDSLDTLVVVGEYDEFAKAVRFVIDNVRFDSDFVVSVFETNIRVVGGLISGHLLAVLVRDQRPHLLDWYDGQLLKMAADVADRLLPAFNTTSGLPHPRVNLKRGMIRELQRQHDTCTACGGTMILEWAALSRLTGNPIYEEKARKAMDFLWNQRNRGSDLMGTVLNVHSGDWVRRDSGIGAGIDSYYEYTLKAYILLGEEDYLHRFNKHYDAVMRYLSKGPLFIDVHMHKPTVAARSYMDSLLAFWPGLQVLKGDLKSAIEMHEMLYLVVQKHKFLPEAFTHDLQVHWAQHPLRPEFLESTYLLYRATKDPHYLEVAKKVMDSIDENVRTRCGFAAVRDVRTMDKADEMESFVLSETFKYLYLIFAEPSDLLFDPDNYVLTTEAHFLPLTIGEMKSENSLPRRLVIDPDEVIEEENEKKFDSACPNVASEYRTRNELSAYGSTLRDEVKRVLNHISATGGPGLMSGTCSKTTERLKAWAFSASNIDHLEQLKKMGIEIQVHQDGKIQLTHSASAAESIDFGLQGMEFMKEMLQIAQQETTESTSLPPAERNVQVVSDPHFGALSFVASPAQFGVDFDGHFDEGEAVITEPYKACSELKNPRRIRGRIAIVQRGGCMFQEKARFAQKAGAIGVIVIDNQVGSSAAKSPSFAMSADTEIEDDIEIPVVFLFHYEGQKLINAILSYPTAVVRISENAVNPAFLFEEALRGRGVWRRQPVMANSMLAISQKGQSIRFNFRFGDVDSEHPVVERQNVVEANVQAVSDAVFVWSSTNKNRFLNYVRLLAYSMLGYSHSMSSMNYEDFKRIVSQVQLLSEEDSRADVAAQLGALATHGQTSSIVCNYRSAETFKCMSL
ncbi:ER degradation-enhancing alpha-mannosidase-like 3-like protein [Aphelenchoides avenae]|nr:ER degradation-enhancing alpha-mannosidase-like 3-like protein [Aphelenchus avenae]